MPGKFTKPGKQNKNMKKLLTILWLIIIGGTTLIAIRLFKPESKFIDENEKLTQIIDNTEKTTIDENAVENKKSKNDKTYSEYIALGDQYIAKKSPSDAIINFEQAVSINPNSSDPLMKLAEAYLLNNQPDKAKTAFEKAAELNPTLIESKIGVARAYLNSREIEKAKDIIWQLDENNKDANNKTIKYYKAIISILYKDYEKAEQLFKELATDTKSKIFLDAFANFSYYKESDELFLDLLLSKALTDVGEYEAAIPLLFDIINKKNNYRDAWITLGFAYLNTAKPKEAIDALLKAKALNEDKPETLFFLGMAYFADDDIDKAIYYIEKADENGFQPKDEIDLKLGNLYILKENFKKAAAKYESVISSNSKNIDVFVRGVWLNIDKLNDTEKALSLSKTAVENHPNKAMSYNLLGWSYTAMEDFKNAETNLKIALSMNPNLDAAHLNFGWLYEKKGNDPLAKEYYKKAYILGKGNSIGNLAAIRFNNLVEQDRQKNYKVDISSP